jgi:hypothetical protein
MGSKLGEATEAMISEGMRNKLGEVTGAKLSWST